MKLPLEIEMGKTVSQFYWTFQNFLNKVLNGHDVSIEHVKLLMLIRANEGCSQQFLVKETMKSKPAITTLLDNMVGKSLLVRVADSNDRRTNLLYLTEKGKKKEEEMKNLLIKKVRELLHDIPEEEVVNGIQRLNTLTNRILEIR